MGPLFFTYDIKVIDDTYQMLKLHNLLKMVSTDSSSFKYVF